MKYEQFKYIVASQIKEYLPEKYIDASVSLNRVRKNNDLVLDALCIRLKDSNVCPNIYLNSFYEQFEDGRSLEDILSGIAQMQIENEDIPDIDTAIFTDFKCAKHLIKARLVNASMNAEYLADKPHTSIIEDDITAIYFVDLSSCEGETMSAAITNSMLDSYCITVGELHRIAVSNLSDDAFFTGMGSLLSELGLPEHAERAEETLFVLTNTSKTNGASMILNDKVMDSVVDRIGTDFFILPSSTHEVILVPGSSGIGVEELAKMVRDVNTSHVAPHERLSDHVYTYDLEHHQLKIAV